MHLFYPLGTENRSSFACLSVAYPKGRDVTDSADTLSTGNEGSASAVSHNHLKTIAFD